MKDDKNDIIFVGCNTHEEHIADNEGHIADIINNMPDIPVSPTKDILLSSVKKIEKKISHSN